MDKEALEELVGFLNHERDDVAQAALQGLAETASFPETQTNLRDTDIVAQLVLCLAREDHTVCPLVSRSTVLAATATTSEAYVSSSRALSSSAV